MRAKTRDLTTGSISKGLWLFAAPLMLGNVLQQFYNLADTWVVGQYIGSGALAAVGSSYTLLTFLTSVVIGLSLGTGAYISQAFGRGEGGAIRNGVFMSFLLTGGLSLLLTGAFYALVDPVIRALRIPPELWGTPAAISAGCSRGSSPRSCITSSPTCCGAWATPPRRWFFWPWPWP